MSVKAILKVVYLSDIWFTHMKQTLQWKKLKALYQVLSNIQKECYKVGVDLKLGTTFFSIFKFYLIYIYFELGGIPQKFPGFTSSSTQKTQLAGSRDHMGSNLSYPHLRKVLYQLYYLSSPLFSTVILKLKKNSSCFEIFV